MKKLAHHLSVSVLMLSLVISGAVTPVLAATSTPSASPTQTTSPAPAETTQKLKDRIEKIVEEKKDQIMGALDDLSSKKRGFIGEVQRVSAESITIKTNKETQIISLTQGATVTKSGKTLPIEDIAVGDWVIVISKLQNDELVPERILVSSGTLRPTPQVVTIGSVVDLDRITLTITTKQNGEEKEFIITKNTEYQDANGDRIKSTAVTSDLQALVVAEEAKAGNELKVVRILAPL